jgi:nucleolar GTP-binding protein
MCTIMKKHAASLAYLEQVRQHMSRLPSIDPNTRTILVCGYPNVGKSSFMNKVTRADVEVQPYAFTTKSIYVGHTDYKYLRWQVLDTPGILDRPLEERNTIEMQSITAMAHLRAVVLYIVDASEQCGYTIKQQSDLFHSIKPLFANKPLVVAINKTDVRKLEDLKPEDAALIDAMRDAARGPASLRMEGDDEDDLPTMSTLNEEGVSLVKQVCCDKLLAARVEQKLASRRAGEVLNRLHVAQPKPRDAVARPAVIPHSVALNRLKKADGSLKIVTEKELQDLNGGAGVYSADLRKDYQLDDDSWKYDIMPEIFNGKNVADFIDPEIDERLAELEREEDELEAAFAEEKAQTEMEAEPDMDDEEKALLKEVRGRRKELVETHRRKKSAGNNAPTLPRTVSASHADPAKRATTKRMKESLEAMGVDPSRAIARARDRSVAREGRLRKRSRSAAETDEAMDDDEEKVRKHSSKSRSVSVARRVDRADRSKSVGLRDDDERMRAQKMADKAQRKMNKRAKIGEADRTIITKMPKHLFSGKRGIGKTDRR